MPARFSARPADPRRALRAGLCGLLLALAACTEAPAPAEPPASARPLPAPVRPEPEAAAPTAPSPASLNMQSWLAGVEERLVARGLLRADDGREIAVDTAGLAQTFVDVALRDEYVREDGRLVRRTTAAPLRRWDTPVRFQIEHGGSVDAEQRRKDRATVATLAARLQAASGHPAALTGAGGNFTILIVNEDERRAIGPRLAALVPGMPAADIRALTDLSPQIFCTVFTYSRPGSPVYTQAVAVIRAELGPRLRLSCFHEEMAQGLGLANDDPRARPSIFNDDEEFAHLTWLDELLLRMLYDRRLRAGMSEAEALPLIRQIAAELIPPAAPAPTPSQPRHLRRARDWVFSQRRSPRHLPADARPQFLRCPNTHCGPSSCTHADALHGTGAMLTHCQGRGSRRTGGP